MHTDFENLLDQLWLMLRRQFYDVFSSKCLCVLAKYGNQEKCWITL